MALEAKLNCETLYIIQSSENHELTKLHADR